MFNFQYQNGKKRKSGKKISGLRSGEIRGSQIGAGFRDYKSGQEGLQTGTALGILNRSEISNWGKDYKSVQNNNNKLSCNKYISNATYPNEHS